MKYAIVMTTTGNAKMARGISEALVRKRLAACVQTFPISSVYSWKGKVAKSKEFILLIKSRSKDYKKLENAIIGMHDYETPEIIQIPITKGSRRYLAWMDDSIGGLK